MVQNAASRSGQSGPISSTRKSASITPGAITALATVDADFAMPGAAVGDVASVSFNTKPVDGIVAGAPYIAVAGHVRIPFANITAGTLTQVAIVANVNLQKAL
jgi:hypothetical protein